MDTILLFTLSKDANCPYNQRIKINNILKKKRENIISKFIKDNPNDANNNQINANIPINTIPTRKIKINSSFKNDNPFFNKKYEHLKYSVSINKNKTNNPSKINLKKKSNIADSSHDDFSSKKSDSKKSNNLSIKSKIDSVYVINNRNSFNFYKERRNKYSVKTFRTDINKKKDKKQKNMLKLQIFIRLQLTNKKMLKKANPLLIIPLDDKKIKKEGKIIILLF